MLPRKMHKIKLRPDEGRPLTREDVAQLTQKRGTVSSIAVKLKESHHYVARLVAAGLTELDIAERTGYSGNRVHQLKLSPAFQELVAKYQGMVTAGMIEQIDEYQRLAFNNMIAAERHIADHIAEADEVGELIPIKTALSISRDAADRFGYGKKQTNVNVNVDFAAQLEATIRRSGKTIDGIATRESKGSPSALEGPQPSPHDAPAEAPPLQALRRL